MKVVINGYDGIVGELKKDADAELASLKAELDKKKDLIRQQNESLFAVESERLLKDAKKRAELEFARRVSRAKVELQDKVLSVKSSILSNVRKLVEERLAGLGDSERSVFVNSLVERALSGLSEPVDFVEVSKGVKVSAKGVDVKQSLQVLGAVVHTKSGAVVSLTLADVLSAKESEFMKLVAVECGW